MNKILAIGFLFLVCLISACGEKESQDNLQKRFTTGDDLFYFYDSSSHMCGQGYEAVGGFSPIINWLAPCDSGVGGKTMALKRMNLDVVYLYDPNMGQCVIGHVANHEETKFWPVPCTEIKERLNPLVRGQVDGLLKRFPPQAGSPR